MKFERVAALSPVPPPNDGIVATAEGALVKMGFKKHEAKSMIAAVRARGGTPSDLSALIGDALRQSR